MSFVLGPRGTPVSVRGQERDLGRGCAATDNVQAGGAAGARGVAAGPGEGVGSGEWRRRKSETADEADMVAVAADMATSAVVVETAADAAAGASSLSLAN